MRAFLSLLLLASLVLSGCTGSDEPPTGPTATGPTEPAPDGTDEPPRKTAPHLTPTEESPEDDQEPEEEPDPPESTNDARPLAVTAMTEAPNLYHESFRRPTWTEHPSNYIPEYPEDALPLNLTLDAETFDEAIAHDGDKLRNLEPYQLYYIPGTVFVGLMRSNQSFGPESFTEHGTGVAANLAGPGPDPSLGTGIVVLPGFGWGAPYFTIEQPWVDVISQSYGTWGPYPPGLSGEVERWWYVEQGGIVTNSVPNLDHSVQCPTGIVCGPSGPPWVVAVGLAYNTSLGQKIGGQGPLDISALQLPCPDPGAFTGNRSCTGTSFSTPRIAGLLASLLADVRASWGWTLCRPQAACADNTTDLPTIGPLADGILEREELLHTFYATGERKPRTLEPTKAIDDQGWGVASPDTAEKAIDVLWGRAPTPERPEAEADWQFYQNLRDAYWGTWLDSWYKSGEVCETYTPHIGYCIRPGGPSGNEEPPH